MPEQNDYKNLYKEIVTNLLEGVMVISMKGKITMLNPAAERMLGLNQEDIGNSFINVFLTREGTDAFNEAILDTIYEKEKVSNMPVDYMLEGELRNLSLTTSYIHNDGEKSVVVVMEDVTELNELRDAQTALDKIQRLNREYEKAKDEAVRANEAKSLFLSNMSHEIRTPINAVLGMNEMILRECSDKQLLSYAANIQSSGKTLLFLINDILDMSKIESGKMEIVSVEYAPENMVMDLWNVIYLRAQEKGLAIRFVLDETLPRRLFGDDVRIKQIVTNLLTNAVKYTPQGSIEMKAAYERQGSETIALIISVADTGMGIREEDMGKLFESFQRLDEEKNRNIEGTGLGMNITMSLLKLMGGDMKVKSEYGRGSVFTVTIPQKVICDEPTGSFEEIKSRREQSLSRKQQLFEAPEASVLVVDDNSMNLTVFQALLKRTKVKVTTADSGKRCLELVKKEKYHMIFMDHMMPELDGVETLHRMKELTENECRDVPVIVLTANAIMGAREKYLEEGFDDYLSKPIQSAKLEAVIKRHIPKIAEQKDIKVQKEHEEELPEIPEFDLAYAKQYFESDQLLLMTLQDVYQELPVMKETLQTYFKGICTGEESVRSGSINSYRTQVHALKSNTAMVGALILSKLARILEVAAIEEDVEKMKAVHPILMEELERHRVYMEVLQNSEEEDEGEMWI